jgi:uncharacterized membrane protein YgcG
VILGAGLTLVAAALPALAEPPAYLSDPITDAAGVLTPQGRAEVATAQEQLLNAEDLQLWVAYVGSFDGLSGQAWAAQSAQASGFGGNDMLFAVAVDDRAYGYDVAADMPVSDADLDAIMARDVEPELRDGDWAGAAVALAAGIEAAAGGGSRTDQGQAGTGANEGGTAGGSVLPWLVGGALLVAGTLLVLWLVRRSRGGKQGDGGSAAAPPVPPEELPVEELRRRVAASLIEADDSIRTSEQELGFAIAQFGEESTGPFTAALAQSKDDVTRAFGLQRQAQEAVGTPAERQLLVQVLALCTAADSRLDDQVEGFDRLRDLERTVDTVLPGLAEQVAALPGRAEAAAATIQQLEIRWPAAALAPLGRQLEQVRERITFAEGSVRVGSELLAAGDRTGAVAHARATEDAIGQAGTLLDVIERAPQTLEVAQRAIDALVVETQKDLAEAEQVGLPPEVAGPHHFAEDTLTWTQQAIASGNYDPVAVLRALEESDAALDRALAPVREAQVRRQRAEALLASATDAASASIQAANDFITTRRGAVGAEARTRLAEAQRRFGQGRAETDPVAALEHMQAADALGDQANALAQQDEARARNAQRRDGGDGALGTMILGGILIDAMTRGGGSHPGPGGGGFRFPGGGGPGPGSFGGSSTRGRRGGGGRF